MTILDGPRILTLALLVMSLAPAFAARNLDKDLGWPGRTLAGADCRGKAQGFGPFDYTDPKYIVAGNYTRHGRKESPLRTVEKVHFTPRVERLIAGEQAVDPIVDIDYTLRAFPNHHRALFAIVRYYMRSLPRARRDDPASAFSPAIRRDIYPAPECYFQRARVFAPNDGMVPALFGLYLHRRGDLDGALGQYEVAKGLLGEHAELYYNLGLLHFDRGEYSDAEKYADMAYQMNYQLPGLRRKLEQRRQ